MADLKFPEPHDGVTLTIEMPPGVSMTFHDRAKIVAYAVYDRPTGGRLIAGGAIRRPIEGQTCRLSVQRALN